MKAGFHERRTVEEVEPRRAVLVLLPCVIVLILHLFLTLIYTSKYENEDSYPSFGFNCRPELYDQSQKDKLVTYQQSLSLLARGGASRTY